MTRLKSGRRLRIHTARCEVLTIHDRHDTLFGRHFPAPSAATLRSLQNYVMDGHYDIGIAADGDADRIGIIDYTGRFLHPNEILVVLYYYLEKYKGWRGPAVRGHILGKDGIYAPCCWRKRNFLNFPMRLTMFLIRMAVRYISRTVAG